MSVSLAFAACCFEHMSLWSYESQILMLLVFPPALLILNRAAWRKLAALSALWYSVPVLYLGLAVARYAMWPGKSYQKTVMRKSWSMAGLLDDWFFNVTASLEFWSWTRGEWKYPGGAAMQLSLVAALVFAAGVVAVVPLRRGFSALGLTARSWCAMLAGGLLLVVLSFPVYLLLDSARGLWRTQILSCVGAGLVFAALAGVASSMFVRRAFRIATFTIVGAVVVYHGSLSAIQKGAFHRWIWERHRAAIVQVVHAAPAVKPDTVIVMGNVPKEDDPFGHNMWFDVALRLVYPGVRVAGIYVYADGTPSPGNNLKMSQGRWTWDNTEPRPAVRDATVASTIVVEYDRSGQGRIAPRIPSYLCSGDCGAGLYNPAAVVAGPVSPRTVRRYLLNRD